MARHAVVRNSDNKVDNAIELPAGWPSVPDPWIAPTNTTIVQSALAGPGDAYNPGTGVFTPAAPVPFIPGVGIWYSVKLAGDLTSSATAFADLTGLFFLAQANIDYEFRAKIIFRSAATTTGIALAVNGPASPRSLVLQRLIPTSLTAVTLGMARAYDNGAATTGVDTANVDNLAILEGMFLNGATAGNLQLRFASEVAASVVTAKGGSVLSWRRT